MTTSSEPKPRRRRVSGTRVIALTGVHGTPGAALLRRLDDDERVSRLVLLDRRAPALPLRKAVSYVVDLTTTLADAAIADVLARERVETVVHAAFHPAPVHTLEVAHELEVIGTRAVLHAVADNVRHAGTVANLVVVGTTMSYGAYPDNPQYLGEDAPLRGGTRYPFVADKVAAEGEVATFRRRTGLPTAMLRAAWTLGDRTTLPACLLAPYVVPAVLGADPLLQFLHVDDLVDAVRLAAHGRADGWFNVAADGVLPLSTVVKLAGRLRASAPPAAVRATLQTLWMAGVGVVPGAHVPYLRYTFAADPARARETLGLRPRYAVADVVARHVAGRRGAHPLAA